MNKEKEKLKELKDILEKFSAYIRVNIHKFDPLKSGIDPDDIYQEVKIKIWKILNDEKKIMNYSSYIKKIVNSSVIDQLRKLRRDRIIFYHEKQKRISENEFNYEIDLLNNKHVEEHLGRAIDSLMESRRIVVKLFLLNMTIEEISIFLKWSRDKTRNLLYRGLSDLKKRLRSKGMDYEK